MGVYVIIYIYICIYIYVCEGLGFSFQGGGVYGVGVEYRGIIQGYDMGILEN